jgi:hypothetical protein
MGEANMGMKNIVMQPLPNPELVYDRATFQQMIRTLELHIGRFDAGADNWAKSYEADKFNGGQFLVGIRTITASDSVDASDTVILANATGGAVTVTLPAVATSEGRQLIVKKIDASANAVTIDGAGSETIDGTTTKSTTTQYALYRIVCDGTYWWTT